MVIKKVWARDEVSRCMVSGGSSLTNRSVEDIEMDGQKEDAQWYRRRHLQALIALAKDSKGYSIAHIYY